MASGSEVDEMIVGSDDNSNLHVLDSDRESLQLNQILIQRLIQSIRGVGIGLKLRESSSS